MLRPGSRSLRHYALTTGRRSAPISKRTKSDSRRRRQEEAEVRVRTSKRTQPYGGRRAARQQLGVAFRNCFPTGAPGGNRHSLWAYFENLHSQHNITDNDLADVDSGPATPGRKRKAMRNLRLWALLARYLEDNDAPRLLRGVARNYL